MLRKALAIAEAAFGKQHPNVANRLNNLATLLHDTNCYEEAEPLLRRALDILDSSSAINRHEHPCLEFVKANYRTHMRTLADEAE